MVRAGSPSEIESAFTVLSQKKADALSIEADPFLLARRVQTALLAAQLSLPTIYPHRENAEAGGLISYGTDLSEGYRQIGMYAGRVLKGESPANLPVMQVTKFELVINKSTAKSLGLAIPNDLLAIADEVID